MSYEGPAVTRRRCLSAICGRDYFRILELRDGPKRYPSCAVTYSLDTYKRCNGYVRIEYSICS